MLSGSCGCDEKWRPSLGWSQPPVSCSPKQPPINVSVCTHTAQTFTHITSLVSDSHTQGPGWLRPENRKGFSAQSVPVTRARLSVAAAGGGSD